IGPARGPAYLAAVRQEMADGAGGQGGYITTSTPLYEQTAVVAPVFNRIVVYASNLLHAGVLAASPASADPRAGRLTANTFFRPQA
ncbi:MAG TPA: DUF6445 family protein, partial [Caulobacter sp.]|nr:DUF6445 family protein [Caulobacter sp.]